VSNLSALAATTFRSPHELGPTPSLETAAREFESYLIGEVLRRSEAMSLHEGLLDGGRPGRMMRGLFHQEIARIVAERGGLGVAEMMTDQLGGAAPAGDGVAAGAAPGAVEDRR
jgi:Rod binding domain-containing protein